MSGIEEIKDFLEDCYDKPDQFVECAFPWGEGPLEGEFIRDWQMEYLVDWGREIRERGFDGRDAVPPVKFSTVSGHGSGKTVLCAWIVLFLHHTRPNSKGTVTAVTNDQLYTKTWNEVKRWHGISPDILGRMSRVFHSKNNMRIENLRSPGWFARAITAAPENATAIQGQHEKSGSSYYLIDEAAGVSPEIFKAMYGGLSQGEAHFHEFGNGTMASGEFHRHHHWEKGQWNTREINVLDVLPGNPWALEQVRIHGIDSDWVRVRVLGKFPSASDLQFIPYSWVRDCMRFDGELFLDEREALVVGVDVAKGGDWSVIYPRRGRVADGGKYPIDRWKSQETLEISDRASVMHERDRPDRFFVDDIGVGAGVTEQMRRNHLPVVQINGGRPSLDRHHFNIRAMVWGRMKAAIREGMALPSEGTDLGDALFSELTSIQYKIRSDERIILESKEDLEKRGYGSPDMADALAYTYFSPVVGRGAGLDPWDRDEGETSGHSGFTSVKRMLANRREGR